MHTRGRGGHIKKTITVTTNCSGSDQTIRLVVEGDVWKAVDVTPTSAAFGRITAESVANEKLVRKLTLVNNLDKPAVIDNIKCTNPLFAVELAVIEEGKKWEMTVAITGAVRSGNNSGKIEATTGLTEMPTLSIPVRVYITADLDVMPPKLTLRPQRPAAMQRQFYVRNNTSKPIEISDIKTSDDRLKASIVETKAGMTWKITVDVPAEYEVPKEGARITFQTNHERLPLMVIPIETASSPVRRPRGTMDARSPKSISAAKDQARSTKPIREKSKLDKAPAKKQPAESTPAKADDAKDAPAKPEAPKADK